MKIIVLGSGSKGNSTYVELNNTKILIDAGLSYKDTKARLEESNIYLKDIDYIFITHEHKDHIYGLPSIIKKHNIKVYVNEKISKCLEIPEDNIIYLESINKINDITIKVIPTSHDSKTSCGYLIEEKEDSLVYITDTGYLNKRYFDTLKDKEYYVFESNHDIEMLTNGKYPAFLQRRILSDKGHLSNEWCARYLSMLIGNHTKKIILAHLSEENNTPEVAIYTVTRYLKDNIDNKIFKNLIVESSSQEHFTEVS